MNRTLNYFPFFTQNAYRGACADVETTELETYIPVAHVDEDKEKFSIEVDLPGLTREDLKIETEKRILTISGERKGKYKVKKTFSLPDEVDTDSIEAKHENGVLKLFLPKAAKALAKEIPIKG